MSAVQLFLVHPTKILLLEAFLPNWCLFLLTLVLTRTLKHFTISISSSSILSTLRHNQQMHRLFNPSAYPHLSNLRFNCPNPFDSTCTPLRSINFMTQLHMLLAHCLDMLLILDSLYRPCSQVYFEVTNKWYCDSSEVSFHKSTDKVLGSVFIVQSSWRDSTCGSRWYRRYGRWRQGGWHPMAMFRCVFI